MPREGKPEDKSDVKVTPAPHSHARTRIPHAGAPRWALAVGKDGDITVISRPALHITHCPVPWEQPNRFPLYIAVYYTPTPYQNSLYAMLIMAHAAVLVASTAIFLALDVLAGPLGFLQGQPPAEGRLRCDRSSFAEILPAGATLEKVAAVRQGGSYGEGTANIAYPTNPTSLPSLCAVTVRVKSSSTSSYRFGLFLPDNWNSKFLVVGNGGFAGGINWLDM